MDAVIRTMEGTVAVEAKLLPDTLDCEVCGNIMDYVSEELGYSCRNGSCTLHVSKETEIEA